MAHENKVDDPQQPIEIPSAWDLNWQPLDTSRDGNVPGPVWKLLRNEQGVSMTYIMHIPPGWRDDELDWHPSTEESFKLQGSSQFPGNEIARWNYLYRPPGILHGPVSIDNEDGSTGLQRMSGDLRILRYDGDEFPHEHLQPITDEHKTWPVEWNENRDLNRFPWEPVTEGPWQGAEVRWAHHNRVTGGGAVMLQIPAGWSGEGSRARGPLEEFVVQGSITIGDTDYGKWGYRYAPAGEAAGTYASEEGAILFCWWDQANELLD